MKILKDVILDNLKIYPYSQPIDFVKLVFQNEFGGGHFIADKNQSLSRLADEYQSIDKSISKPLFEDIGNNIARLNLQAINTDKIDLSTINSFFCVSAKNISGNKTSFEQKLEELKTIIKTDELAEYIEQYKTQGYPAVSHSKNYKQHYSPAYRIVLDCFIKYFDLFCLIDQMLKQKKIVLIAIDGKSASGKSFLGSLLHDVYADDSNLFHCDDYFLRPHQKTLKRLEEAGGNMDYRRLKNELINNIQLNNAFEYHKYDCQTQTLSKPILAKPKKINIIEGSYSLHPHLSDFYDIKVFMNISEQTQKNRILKRNGNEMLETFLKLWIPKENKYFEEMQPQNQCDFIFNTDK